MLQITGVVDARQMRAQYLDRMDIERERGITIKSQAVRLPWVVREGEQTGEQAVLNMIDTPGHVDFTYEVSRSLAACEGAVLLVDAAQGIEAQTLANLYLAMENDLTVIPVLNKIDLPAAQPDKYAEELAHLIGVQPEDCLRVSGKTGEGVAHLLDEIVRQLPPPVGRADEPVRAMIFDSVYDVYRGVITYVRVIDGRIEARDRIKMMSTGAVHELLELGVISPEPKKAGAIGVGEVGYLMTGVKDVRQSRVGDTVTINTRPAKERPRRLQGPEADGLLGSVPDRRIRVPQSARRARQAQAQRRGAALRAGDLGRARVRLPVRLPRPAPPGDHPGAAGARVRPRSHLHRPQRGLPGRARHRRRAHGDQPERVPHGQGGRGVRAGGAGDRADPQRLRRAR